MKKRFAFTAVLVCFMLVFTQFNLVSASTNTETIALNFKPLTSLMDPAQPLVYLTSLDQNLLYAVNLQTKEIKTLSFLLKPEQLAYDNKQLFVTFSVGNHQSGSTGKVVVINTDTFKQVDEFNVNVDPFGITVKDGYIYISPNSGGNAGFTNYSLATKEPHTNGGVYANSALAVNPKISRIYTIEQGSSTYPRSLDVYQGSLVNYLTGPQARVPYIKHDLSSGIDVPFLPFSEYRLKVSPDGQYVFDSSGQLMDANLNLVTKLGYMLNDVAFDPDSNNFYVAEENVIKAYGKDYQMNTGFVSFNNYTVLHTLGTIKDLYFRNSQLIALTKTGSGQDQLEVLTAPAAYVSSLEYNDYHNIPLDFTPTAILYDPNQPLIYLTDENNHKLYSVNYKTHEVKILAFSAQPEKLALVNNKLYVTLFKAPHEDNNLKTPPPGQVEIINTDTFTISAEIQLETDPLDIAVSNDGYIYILGGVKNTAKISSYSETTKQLVATFSQDYNSGFYSLAINPLTNQLYTNGYFGASKIISVNHGQFGTSSFLAESTLNNVTISPDGQYIMGGGVVRDHNLKELGRIPDMTGVAFDLTNHRFFVQTSETNIDVYDYDALKSQSLKKLSSLTSTDTIRAINFQNGELISISKNINKSFSLTEHYVEKLPLVTQAAQDLTIVSGIPLEKSSNLPIDSPQDVVFSQEVFSGSNFSGVKLQNGTLEIPCDVKIENNSLEVTPKNDLSYDAQYTLTVPEDAVMGYTGKSMKPGYTLTFKTDQEFSRLGGLDRYATSAEISKKGWQHSDYAVLVYGGNFPDALCATPLAAKFMAPILLTEANTLSPTADAEITRLGVKRVFIVGGTGVVSAQIEENLKSRKIQVVRLAGTTRYDTSAEVANYFGPSEQVFIASGENFPDALSIASYAASQGSPILLTGPTSLSASILDYIKNNGVNKAYLIGGSSVIPRTIYYDLPDPESIYGETSYDTNMAVLHKFSFNYSVALIASGESFPDALAGSALAAMGQYPVILLSNSTSKDIIDEINYNKNMIKMKYILGGTVIMPNALIDQVFKNKN